MFPKYSVARSYNKALLTEAYRDLLLPHHNLSNSPATPTADVEECQQVLRCVLEMTRQANSYIVEDMKVCIYLVQVFILSFQLFIHICDNISITALFIF